jgi:hypothetical protein
MDPLDEFLKINKNSNLIEEINDIFTNNEIYEEIGLNENNFQDCSLSTNPIILPNISGLLFFKNYNILQCGNVIIPDIFRICFSIPPIIFKKNINFTLICPKIGIVAGNNKFSFSRQRIQRLLPDNIIKAFFYFGYSSDLNTDISFKDLVEQINDYILSKNNNPEKYYNIEYIFNTIYSKNTLIQQILSFSSTLQYIRSTEIDGTNFCNYKLGWLFSYYCYTRQLGKYNIFNNINNNSIFSYSDLTLLNYVLDESNENFSIEKIVIFLNRIGENNPQFDESIKEFEKELAVLVLNNIFKIINLANEVKQYIIEVIQNVLSNKQYNEQIYSSPIFFNITQHLYSTYVKNENYL